VSFEALLLVLDSTIRLSVPLLFAALAGLYSERSGVVNIALEGKMLGAAFAAGAAAALSGSAWIGLLAAAGVGLALALVHAVACVTFRGNQIVSGVAINTLAFGLTALLGIAWFAQGGRTPQLGSAGRFQPLDLPLAEAARGLPLIGDLYAEVLSGHSALAYAAFAAVPLTAWVLRSTRFGLRLRAVGENPAAIDTAGISVAWLRTRAVLIAGVLCGFGGAYLALVQSAGFIPNITAGRGFIALAALIFANWRPVPAMFACLLFGLLDAVAIRMQGAPLPGLGEVPVQFIQALPYILTVVLLAGFVRRAEPPRAIGEPYRKER